jgi:hypothetical protein
MLFFSQKRESIAHQPGGLLFIEIGGAFDRILKPPLLKN